MRYDEPSLPLAAQLEIWQAESKSVRWMATWLREHDRIFVTESELRSWLR